MSLLGILIQKGVRLGAKAQQSRPSAAMQRRQLSLLLRKARRTAFGRYHQFDSILQQPDIEDAFRSQAPAVDYNEMYRQWWSRAHREDEPNVCWPGLTPYYALSSGTSQAASKFIPVTDDMLRMIKRGSRRLFYDVANFYPHRQLYSRQVLMVGSCTAPAREGLHYTGDVSGILGLNRPLWMETFYRPGRAITDLPDWGARIERIAEEAPQWDIGAAVANPMWLQLVLERIIERRGLRHIHELWPNFSLLAHGGVFMEPYRPTLEKLWGKPVSTINTYLASEGYFAYQPSPRAAGLQLLGDCGVYFEFVPFNAKNFDENGDLRTHFPKTYTLDEVVEGQTYALLISTCAGAWRYLLGDTVQFVDAAAAQFQLVGRTKQSLSVCGEHLSIDNLNAAVLEADRQLQAGIREFAVAGVRSGTGWAHRWYVSIDNPDLSPEALAGALDAALCRLNDDYAVERRYALRSLEVHILPHAVFLQWLDRRGKMNGQAKVPRVLKATQLTDFECFIKGMPLPRQGSAT